MWLSKYKCKEFISNRLFLTRRQNKKFAWIRNDRYIFRIFRELQNRFAFISLLILYWKKEIVEILPAGSSLDNLQWVITMSTRSCHRNLFQRVHSCSQLKNLCISQRSILILSHLKMYVTYCDILPKIVHCLLFPTFKLRVSSIQQAYFAFYYYCFCYYYIVFILQGSYS
jgi:hypothetical protein